MLDMHASVISYKTAVDLVVSYHYLHRKPPISIAYGLFNSEGILKGVMTFGTPASHHMVIGACPSEPESVIELNRLWVCDTMPRNTESWFISRVLAEIPPKIVLSYADTTMGHVGIVYRAANFFYAGWTDMDRKTPRFDYIAPGKHSRDAFRSGFVDKVRRKPKIKYWTVSGRRSERKRLEKICCWPKLDWKTNPPPIEHAKLSEQWS